MVGLDQVEEHRMDEDLPVSEPPLNRHQQRAALSNETKMLSLQLNLFFELCVSPPEDIVVIVHFHPSRNKVPMPLKGAYLVGTL